MTTGIQQKFNIAETKILNKNSKNYFNEVKGLTAFTLYVFFSAMNFYILAEVVDANYDGHVRILLRISLPIALSFVLACVACKNLALRKATIKERIAIKETFIDMFTMGIGLLPVISTILFSIATFGTSVFSAAIISKFLTQYYEGIWPILQSKQISFQYLVVIWLTVTSFFSYWNHRLWHRPFFWPIHRYHHSTKTMNFVATYRNHPAERLFHPFFKYLPLAIVQAPQNAIIIISTLTYFHELMQHSGGSLSWGFIGKYIISDPLMHEIHHSKKKEHFDCNFGSITPLWDHIFGTLVRDPNGIMLGVSNDQHYQSFNILKIIIIDFKDFTNNIRTLMNDQIKNIIKKSVRNN